MGGDDLKALKGEVKIQTVIAYDACMCDSWITALLMLNFNLMSYLVLVGAVLFFDYFFGSK